MKFVSKSSNLLIVLRAGLSAQPITGTPATPTISVRFTDGIAEVNDESLIEMMLKHPGFNADFISAETPEEDIYASARQASEPVHVMTELKHGTPVSREIKGGKAATLSPELQKIIESQAQELAKKLLPGMVESTIKAIVDKGEANTPTKGTDDVVDVPEPIVAEQDVEPVQDSPEPETPKRRGRPSSK